MDSESDQDEGYGDETVVEPDGSTRPKDIFDNEEGESESSDKEAMDEDGETDDESEDDKKPQPETDRLLDRVYSTVEPRLQTLTEQLMADDCDEDEAREEAYEHLLPVYQKEFRKQLGDALEQMEQFRREPVYILVTKTAKELQLDGLSRKESIRAAIRNRKYKINKFVPKEFEEEGEEEESEEGDEEEEQ